MVCDTSACGGAGLGVLNTFFEYDIAEAQWVDLSLPRDGTPPTPRSRFGFAKWKGMLYVVGGGIVPSIHFSILLAAVSGAASTKTFAFSSLVLKCKK